MGGIDFSSSVNAPALGKKGKKSILGAPFLKIYLPAFVTIVKCFQNWVSIYARSCIYMMFLKYTKYFYMYCLTLK